MNPQLTPLCALIPANLADGLSAPAVSLVTEESR